MNGLQKKIALKLRKELNVQSDSLINLSSHLEEAGTVLYSKDMSLDGCSFHLDSYKTNPIIVTNKNLSVERLRFTLAHELGHLVMHRGTFLEKKMEEEANQFASEFLMPSEMIQKDFKKLTKYTLMELLPLKFKWKVSIQAIIEKAHDLQHIGPIKKESLYKHLSMKGWRIKEPYPLDPQLEKHYNLKDIFQLYVDKLKYQLQDFAKLFALTEKRLLLFYKDYLPEELHISLNQAKNTIKFVPRKKE